MDENSLPVMDLGQYPLELPPALATGTDHYTAFHDLVSDLKEYGQSGPVALAWRWALTGHGPRPVSLLPWDAGPPDREQLAAEARETSAWPADNAQVEQARGTLLMFGADPYGEAEDRAADDWRDGFTGTIDPAYDMPLLQPPKYR